MEEEHECIICEYEDYTNSYLYTLNELLADAKMEDSFYKLKDYLDFRKYTNIIRFDYCPFCGKEIDWIKIKEENKC